MTTPLYNISNLQIVKQPSYTYKITADGLHVAGMLDDNEAILQVVTKILNTQRYECLIYSSNYGVEYNKVLGQDYEYVLREIERMTREALLVDDRIMDVIDFVIVRGEKDSVVVTFTVITTSLSFTTTLEVAI